MIRPTLNPRPRFELLLDSGAFTAWRSKLEIKLKHYIEFCQDAAERGLLYAPVGLDEIPKCQPGTPPTPAELERSASVTAKNNAQMRKEGVTAVPVFHYRERFYWFEKMLDDAYPYIGLAARSARGGEPAAVRAWYGRCFDLVASRGKDIKVHGFGETRPGFMQRFPWYSVDSSSADQYASYGMALIPRGGKPTPFKLSLADATPGSATRRQRQHGRYPAMRYASLGRVERAYVDRYLAELGFDEPLIRANKTARLCVNAHYLCRVKGSHTRVHVTGNDLLRVLQSADILGLPPVLISYARFIKKSPEQGVDALAALLALESTPEDSKEARARATKGVPANV